MTKLLDDLAEFVQLQKERESMEYGPDRAQAYEACLSKAFHLLDELAAEIERNARDAERYRCARDGNADYGAPYIARERQDSWGNWKTEWLSQDDADQAIDDAMRGGGE